MRLAAAILATVGLAIVGHWALYGLLLLGTPLLYARPGLPGFSWVGGVGRLLFYLCLVTLQAGCWRLVAGARRPHWVWVAPLALLVSAYWLLVDPVALSTVLGPGSAKEWLEWTWRRPFLSDLYWGWGFTTHQWLLVALQGLLTAGGLYAVPSIRPRQPRVEEA